MRRVTLFVLVVAVLAVGASAALAADKPQTTCPVSGETLEKGKTASVEMQGQKVYFCCEKCVKTFKADPDKYFEKMAKEGVVAENVQKADPVCGMKIDAAKSAKLDWKGRRLYFCSDGCKAKFEKEPATYLKKMDEKPAKA